MSLFLEAEAWRTFWGRGDAEKGVSNVHDSQLSRAWHGLCPLSSHHPVGRRARLPPGRGGGGHTVRLTGSGSCGWVRGRVSATPGRTSAESLPGICWDPARQRRASGDTVAAGLAPPPRPLGARGPGEGTWAQGTPAPRGDWPRLSRPPPVHHAASCGARLRRGAGWGLEGGARLWVPGSDDVRPPAWHVAPGAGPGAQPLKSATSFRLQVTRPTDRT